MGFVNQFSSGIRFHPASEIFNGIKADNHRVNKRQIRNRTNDLPVDKTFGTLGNGQNFIEPFFIFGCFPAKT